jgi:hypothetical protein
MESLLQRQSQIQSINKVWLEMIQIKEAREKSEPKSSSQLFKSKKDPLRQIMLHSRCQANKCI